MAVAADAAFAADPTSSADPRITTDGTFAAESNLCSLSSPCSRLVPCSGASLCEAFVLQSFAVEVLLRKCLCSGSRQCEVRLELLSLHAACISDSPQRAKKLHHILHDDTTTAETLRALGRSRPMIYRSQQVAEVAEGEEAKPDN